MVNFLAGLAATAALFAACFLISAAISVLRRYASAASENEGAEPLAKEVTQTAPSKRKRRKRTASRLEKALAGAEGTVVIADKAIITSAELPLPDQPHAAVKNRKAAQNAQKRAKITLSNAAHKPSARTRR